MARPLIRIAVLAAGAGAAWYARQRLRAGDGGSPEESAPGAAAPASSAYGVPESAPTPASSSSPPPSPASPAPDAQLTEPAPSTGAPLPPDLDEEPAPTAFEDAHPQGWYDEELGKDPAAQEELESDPATADEAELARAAEDADEIEEPEVAPQAAGSGRGEPGHVTRVVDDLLEGRGPEPTEEPIEDATVVEDEREEPSG